MGNLEPEQCNEVLIINSVVSQCSLDKGHPGNHLSGAIETGTGETHLLEWGTIPGKTAVVIDFSTYVELFLNEPTEQASAIHYLSGLLHDELIMNDEEHE